MWRRTVAAMVATLWAGCGLTPPPSPAQTPQQTPSPQPPVNTNPDAPPLPGYALAWQDDFDGSALGPAWTALSGPRLGAIAGTDTIDVHGGILTLRTYTDASGRHHTGFLDTRGKVEATYGYFEARIRFDDAPGEWCAFWLDSPTNGKPIGNPGTAGVEIDVVEHRVTDAGGWTALRDMVAFALNWDLVVVDRTVTSRKNVSQAFSLPGDAPVQGTWHVYGVLWTEAGYTFYVDGDPLWTSAAAVSNRSEYLQLTCEVLDASWAGDVPAAGYGSRATSTTGMQVDWVRIWQKP
jgi:hypothetical protein